jgi:hypothetical protein
MHAEEYILSVPDATPNPTDADREPIIRDLGPQPLADLLAKHELKSQDLVAASTEQITHKMVVRACKGRRLTKKVQLKIRNAINAAAKSNYELADLFNYR